jgi:hypothetical protein
VHPTHRIAIAAILGLAAVAGLIGLTRSLDLGAAATPTPRVSPAAVARGNHRLDRAEAALRRARASRPPALPPIPKYPAVPTASPAPAAPAVGAVTYVRPPPRIATVHRTGGEGDDHQGGSEGQDD